jgi:hypothetical protein
LIADLYEDRHAHVFGAINCPQFRMPKPIHFVVDTGSTNTTLLSDDVTRLGINCDDLAFAPIPCRTADGIVTPYLLPKVELMFVTKHGWFNRIVEVATFGFINIHCFPPTATQLMTKERLARCCSLLGMDFLDLFKKWRFTERTLILDTK